jgi:hypothetical protein
VLDTGALGSASAHDGSTDSPSHLHHLHGGDT